MADELSSEPRTGVQPETTSATRRPWVKPDYVVIDMTQAKGPLGGQFVDASTSW